MISTPMSHPSSPNSAIITHSARTPDIMHQPMVQPMVDPMFRRGSFGMEASLKTAIPTNDAAQQFQEVLNRSERPVPSRRSSLRTVPAAFPPPPPPPPPPASSVLESMRMASHAASMRSPSPSPIVDMSTGTDTRKIHHSPIRSPPSLSSAPRRNSSQAEHFMRSSLSPPPSANKRTYSFAREQARKPTVPGGPIIPPSRTNSCPPDADMFPTRGVRSNSDGYNSASTSFMTECSVSPTSSDSSQPSDIEDIHIPHIKTKAPEQASSFSLAAQLEMESRRLELVWQETEKQWKDKHGTTLPRSQDMAFRRKIESGITIKDESPIDKEWRDMWKNANNCWSESEARWRKEDAHRRTASRNDDSHFHTAHSDTHNISVADDDKVMNAIMSHFGKEMEKRRQRAERKRLEEVEQAERKRREEESDVWRAALERESESRRSSSQGIVKDQHVEHSWLPDRLMRPDITRTRSSSVIVEPRPAFQRSRSGSVATIVDPLSSDVGINPLPTNLAPPAVEHARVKRSRSSRESRESFELPLPEEDPARAQVEKQRSEEIRKNYIGAARQQLYTPATEVPRTQHAKSCDSAASDETEREIPRAKGHQRGPSTTSNGESHSPRPSLSPSNSTRDVPLAVQQDGGFSIAEEVWKLEREQAALARRIQELRAAAEGTEGSKPTPPAPVLAPVDQERERGREKNKDLKVKVGEQPRAKSQTVRKHTDNEGAVFKAMQERSRKTEQPAPDSNRKPEPVAITPEVRPATAVLPQGEPSGRVHFVSNKRSAEDLPLPTPPRVRTPGPTKIHTPARVRTPSPRSSSPVNVASTSSFAPTMAREAPVVHEAVPSVHEAVAPSSSPRIHTTPSQPTLRPSGKSREAGLNGMSAERPKSSTMPTLSVPHVNTSNSPIDAAHDQGASPLGARTPRATNFDPDRTPRAQTGPVPDSNEKPGSPPLARVYINPHQVRARPEVAPVEPPVRMEESSRRRMDAAVGANVAAAAAETFDRAGGKKRTKEAEFRAQEERRAAEEQLVREQRRAEEDRRIREEQRAEEARRREAAERREREDRARYEQLKRENEERKRRWANDPSHERVSRAQQQPTREPSALDAWNSYELRWSALSVASSTQPIGFRDIPWPLLRIPTGPEAITPQAVGAFILSPLHSQDKSRKERLRNAMLRWHSDKFEGRWMARIEEEDRPKVKEAVGAVARSLTELMTKPDLY
ncbi:unnamed protein product [Rhizoctonia solani]|uniref:Uncharacterized protein n=1 Tax=Rhizoctonia solani TaxID=456999 RepID=A0A8H3BWK9_9AGAM|nr:unnamed protein product [Rhizoctonia solani]